MDHTIVWTADMNGITHINHCLVWQGMIYGVGGEYFITLSIDKGALLRTERRMGARFASLSISGAKVVAVGSSRHNKTDVLVSTWDLKPQQPSSPVHATLPSGLGAPSVVLVQQHCQSADGSLLVVGAVALGTASKLFMMRVGVNLDVEHVWTEEIRTSNSEMILGCAFLPEVEQRVILVGRSDLGGFIFRYGANGVADKTYGINANGHSFVPQVSAFEAVMVFPDGSALALGHKENRVVLVKFNALGHVDITFGSSSGMTSRSFGAPSDVAFAHSLLFFDNVHRFMVIGWVSFGGVEKEMVALEYVAPQDLLERKFGPATQCLCAGADTCVVQGPNPLQLDNLPDMTATASNVLVNAELNLTGARATFVASEATHFVVLGALIVEGANLTVRVPENEAPPQDGAILRVVHASHIVGRAASVNVNATTDACHEYVGTQVPASDDGFLRIRVALRELPSCRT